MAPSATRGLARTWSMSNDSAGKIFTVRGAINPSELGVTLTHEHLFVHFEGALQSTRYLRRDVTDLEFKLENLGVIRHYPYSVKSNLTITCPDLLCSELQLYKKAGGCTIVDCTPSGLRYKPELLVDISQRSGVNIISGCGYYVDAFMSEETKMMTKEEMAAAIIQEVQEGIKGTTFRCGVIGEIGCSSPLTDNETKSLQAAAMAQHATGAPLIIHPGRSAKSPFEIAKVLEAAGADMSRTVMSHLDRTIFDKEQLLQFAKRGTYLEYDLFGIECSHYQFADMDMPSDAQRIEMVKFLIDQGYQQRIMVAQDIHTKHRLVQYGGHGYGHILNNIVPKMADRSIEREVMMNILTQNPKEWLTFTTPHN